MDSHLRALLISGAHTMWIVITRIYNCPMSVATTSSAPPQEPHSWGSTAGCLRSSGRDTPSPFIPNSAPLAPPQPSCFLPGSLRFFLVLLLGMSNLLLLLVEVSPDELCPSRIHCPSSDPCTFNVTLFGDTFVADVIR